MTSDHAVGILLPMLAELKEQDPNPHFDRYETVVDVLDKFVHRRGIKKQSLIGRRLFGLEDIYEESLPVHLEGEYYHLKVTTDPYPFKREHGFTLTLIDYWKNQKETGSYRIPSLKFIREEATNFAELNRIIGKIEIDVLPLIRDSIDKRPRGGGPSVSG